MGSLGDQPQSALLQAHCLGAKAGARRSGELGTGHGARGPLSRSLVMSLRRAAARLLASLRRRRLDQDLDADILAHLELAEKDAMARGLSREQARRAARLEFGGIEQMREEHRDQRSVRPLESLL